MLHGHILMIKACGQCSITIQLRAVPVVPNMTLTSFVAFVRKAFSSRIGFVSHVHRITMQTEVVNAAKECSIRMAIVTIALLSTTETDFASVPSRTCITTRSITDVLTVLRTTTQTAVVNAMKECSIMTGNVTTAQQTTMQMDLANVPKVFSGW